jgi:hypothetical protein
MNNQSIINELKALEAYADELKSKATGLRKKLEGLYSPAPQKGKVRMLGAHAEIKLIGNRRKHITKKIS